MSTERVCGIYCIENTVNHKRYIGQSVDIYRRWQTHRYLLNENKHDNDYLQKAWNKYGEDNFVFSILERCDKDELSQIETKYINTYQTLNEDYGYNLQSGGASQYYLSDATKQKISQALTGKMAGENNPRYGKPVSDETREKIRQANINPSEETREKMRRARLGTKASDETKQKLREARKNQPRQPHSEETKKKLSEIAKERFKDTQNCPMFGKNHTEESKKKIGDGHRNPSEETRKKMSESAKARCTEEWRQKKSEQYQGKFSGEDNPMFGKRHTDAAKEKMRLSSKKSRPVLQYDLNGNLLMEYNSIRDAESTTGVSRDVITRCCNKGVRPWDMYDWKFKEAKE